MATTADAAEASLLRRQLKQFERMFQMEHHRKPTKQDVLNHPLKGDLLPVYLRYGVLKKQLGKRLHNSAPIGGKDTAQSKQAPAAQGSSSRSSHQEYSSRQESTPSSTNKHSARAIVPKGCAIPRRLRRRMSESDSDDSMEDLESPPEPLEKITAPQTSDVKPDHAHGAARRPEPALPSQAEAKKEASSRDRYRRISESKSEDDLKTRRTVSQSPSPGKAVAITFEDDSDTEVAHGKTLSGDVVKSTEFAPMSSKSSRAESGNSSSDDEEEAEEEEGAIMLTGEGTEPAFVEIGSQKDSQPAEEGLDSDAESEGDSETSEATRDKAAGSDRPNATRVEIETDTDEEGEERKYGDTRSLETDQPKSVAPSSSSMEQKATASSLGQQGSKTSQQRVAKPVETKEEDQMAPQPRSSTASASLSHNTSKHGRATGKPRSDSPSKPSEPASPGAQVSKRPQTDAGSRPSLEKKDSSNSAFDIFDRGAAHGPHGLFDMEQISSDDEPAPMDPKKDDTPQPEIITIESDDDTVSTPLPPKASLSMTRHIKQEPKHVKPRMPAKPVSNNRADSPVSDDSDGDSLAADAMQARKMIQQAKDTQRQRFETSQTPGSRAASSGLLAQAKKEPPVKPRTTMLVDPMSMGLPPVRRVKHSKQAPASSSAVSNRSGSSSAKRSSVLQVPPPRTSARGVTSPPLGNISYEDVRRAVWEMQDFVLSFRWKSVAATDSSGTATSTTRSLRQEIAVNDVVDSFDSVTQYQETFSKLILEEFRAEMCQELERSSSRKSMAYFVSFSAIQGEGHAFVSFEIRGELKIDEIPENTVVVLYRGKGPEYVSKLGEDADPAPTLGIISQYSDGKAKIRVPVEFHHLFGGGGTREFSLYPLANMVTSQRQYVALKFLDNSPLLPYVLAQPERRPKPPPSEVLEPVSDQEIQDKTKFLESRLNPAQLAAVRSSLSTSAPCSFIHGPPGTGKTSTLLSLLGAFLSVRKDKAGISARGPMYEPVAKRPARQLTARERHSGIRRAVPVVSPTDMQPQQPTKSFVLVCAPSNAAIDELTRRLGAGVPGPAGLRKVSVVRIGTAQRIAADAQQYSLDYQVNQRLQQDVAADTSSKEAVDKDRKQLGEICDTIRSKEKELNDYLIGIDVDPNNMELDRQRRRLEAEIEKLRQKQRQVKDKLKGSKAEASDVRHSLDAKRAEIRRSILNEAEVVCCTLSGSALEMVREMGRPLSLVIVDEAAQCLEPDTLVPMQYGCAKLVLVGDPCQLSATVNSSRCKAAGYGRSLFERTRGVLEQWQLVSLLNLQYRMHPEICSFPNKRFYNKQLRTDQSVLDRPRLDLGKPFLPYMFVNVRGKEARAQSSTSLFNQKEAEAIANFIKLLQTRNEGDANVLRQIGVITPYRKQREVVGAVLETQLGKDQAQRVEVDTVDSFQGREKDIVLFSCVRTGHNIGFLADEKRMNVALTRAKLMLGVFGNESSLARSGNRSWKALTADARHRRCIVNVEDFEHAIPAARSQASDSKPRKRPSSPDSNGHSRTKRRHISRDTRPSASSSGSRGTGTSERGPRSLPPPPRLPVAPPSMMRPGPRQAGGEYRPLFHRSDASAQLSRPTFPGTPASASNSSVSQMPMDSRFLNQQPAHEQYQQDSYASRPPGSGASAAHPPRSQGVYRRRFDSDGGKDVDDDPGRPAKAGAGYQQGQGYRPRGNREKQRLIDAVKARLGASSNASGRPGPASTHRP